MGAYEDVMGDGDMFFDKEGKPIDIEEWGKLRHDEDYMRIGIDDVGPFQISTVWVGMGPKYEQFETIIFGGPNQERYTYATEQAAIDGHHAMLYALSATRLDIEGWVLMGG